MDSPVDDYLSPENLNKLRLTPPALPFRKASPRILGQFIRGPIPLAWLSRAAKLRGKGPLAVALALRFESGRKGGSPSVKVTNQLVAKFGVSRKAKYAALQSLQKAGLIELKSEPRKTPVAFILEASAWEEDSANQSFAKRKPDSLPQ